MKRIRIRRNLLLALFCMVLLSACQNPDEEITATYNFMVSNKEKDFKID